MIGREKKCILLTADEFRDVVKSLYDEEVYIDFSADGLYVGLTEDELPAEDLHERLAQYFYVDGISSIHIDDYEPCGVWLVCKNETLTHTLDDGTIIYAEKYPDPDKKEICISLQDAVNGIIFQDLAVIGPDYDEIGNPLRCRYKVRVYGDSDSENPTHEIPILMHGYHGYQEAPFDEEL